MLLLNKPMVAKEIEAMFISLLFYIVFFLLFVICIFAIRLLKIEFDHIVHLYFGPNSLSWFLFFIFFIRLNFFKIGKVIGLYCLVA